MNSAAMTENRQFGVDVFELTIPAASRSGKHWKMADEILYVLDGEGYSLHWEVQAEIAEKYYARIAKEPTRHEIKKGDTLYVPQNTVVQHFAADGSELRMLASQNRVFKYLGYDTVHYFENAPEYDAAELSASARV
jgi:quercetin dioxygenase-like cupin family protein